MRTSKRRQKASAEKTVNAPAFEVEPPQTADPLLFLNRELGLLSFQYRVLDEAQNKTNPLLERVNFLSIVGSNLDEFFMVRVAGLIAQVDSGLVEAGPDGLSPSAQLVAIRREVKKLFVEAHRCWRELATELSEDRRRRTRLLATRRKTTPDRRRVFPRHDFPGIDAARVRSGRPFPHISNRSLNLAVLIRDSEGQDRFARIKVPSTLPQFVPLDRHPKQSAKRRLRKHLHFVWLEQLIVANLNALFPGMHVVEAHPFHVTRDAEVAIKELEAEDLLETIEAGVRQRRFGDVVRLEVTADMPASMLDILMSNLELSPSELYRVNGPLSLSRFSDLAGIDRPAMKYPPFVPAQPACFSERR